MKEQHKHRVDVAYALLASGVPFSVLAEQNGELRRLLEVGRGNLPHRDISDLVPAIMAHEFRKVAESMQEAKAISISFDSSDEIAEIFAVTVRYVSPTHTIETRCIDFRLLSKTLKGSEICAILVDLLCVRAQVQTNHVHYGTRDGASSNTNAMKNMQILNPLLVDLTCLSHSVNIAGKELVTTCAIANYAIHKWAELSNNSRLTRNDYAERTGEQVKRLSKVRWFSWQFIAAQMHRTLSAILQVLANPNIGSPTLRDNLLQFINNNINTLRIELALIVDAGTKIAEACYCLEGDGFIAPFAYDAFATDLVQHGESVTGRTVAAHGNPNLPEVIAVIADIHGDDENNQHQLLLDTARKAEPTFNKLLHDIEHRIAADILAYRACRLVQPGFIAVNTLDALEEELLHLNSLPHLAQRIPMLTAELPAYKAIVNNANIQDVQLIHDGAKIAWTFWRRNALRLPEWFHAACEVALVATSSASVERIFAVHRQVFTDQQEMTLEDRRASCVMIRYNRAKENSNL